MPCFIDHEYGQRQADAGSNARDLVCISQALCAFLFAWTSELGLREGTAAVVVNAVALR
jgi:hypothetical protein